ncbi:MAG: glutathione peroxidase [Chitinophagaceae bacterium]|nr:glutathione peroxidase [Chitinophagaceae bacterium]
MFNTALSLLCFLISSIYNIQFQNTDGGTVNMNTFQGKKILLVNIATGSTRVSQLAGLQQLQQTYADSLVVIAFPSNSFGNESNSNASIKQFCQTNYNTTFIIAAKAPVSGAGLHPIYSWLSSRAQNGDLDLQIAGDFQKVLIAKDGSIQAVFSPKLDPMNEEITDAITASY